MLGNELLSHFALGSVFFDGLAQTLTDGNGLLTDGVFTQVFPESLDQEED